jgi:anti-sigma regulatory factor (Ser/Thr protein kinase)
MTSTTETRDRGGLDTRLKASWRPIAHATGYPTFTALMQRDELAGDDARRMLSTVLAGWGLMELKDEMDLVATELVANAAKHARGDVIRVNIQRTAPRRVRVTVTDKSREQPKLQKVDELAESGRGLVLVQALASAVGVIPLPWGKSVWAEVTAK